MSTQPQSPERDHTSLVAAPEPAPAPHPASEHAHRHGVGHLLMMALMCAPMLLVVGVLMTTGRAGATAVLPALLCVGMMAAMMGMHGGHGRR